MLETEWVRLGRLWDLGQLRLRGVRSGEQELGDSKEHELLNSY